MTVYEHRTTLTTASGTVRTATCYIPGGIGTQLLVRATTADTVFRVVLTDGKGTERRHYGFHKGELNDTTDAIRIGMAGSYGISITNASPDDTFQILLAVQE